MGKETKGAKSYGNLLSEREFAKWETEQHVFTQQLVLAHFKKYYEKLGLTEEAARAWLNLVGVAADEHLNESDPRHTTLSPDVKNKVTQFLSASDNSLSHLGETIVNPVFARYVADLIRKEPFQLDLDLTYYETLNSPFRIYFRRVLVEKSRATYDADRDDVLAKDEVSYEWMYKVYYNVDALLSDIPVLRQFPTELWQGTDPCTLQEVVQSQEVRVPAAKVDTELTVEVVVVDPQVPTYAVKVKGTYSCADELTYAHLVLKRLNSKGRYELLEDIDVSGGVVDVTSAPVKSGMTIQAELMCLSKTLQEGVLPYVRPGFNPADEAFSYWQEHVNTPGGYGLVGESRVEVDFSDPTAPVWYLVFVNEGPALSHFVVEFVNGAKVRSFEYNTLVGAGETARLPFDIHRFDTIQRQAVDSRETFAVYVTSTTTEGLATRRRIIGAQSFFYDFVGKMDALVWTDPAKKDKDAKIGDESIYTKNLWVDNLAYDGERGYYDGVLSYSFSSLDVPIRSIVLSQVLDTTSEGYQELLRSQVEGIHSKGWEVTAEEAEEHFELLDGVNTKVTVTLVNAHGQQYSFSRRLWGVKQVVNLYESKCRSCTSCYYVDVPAVYPDAQLRGNTIKGNNWMVDETGNIVGTYSFDWQPKGLLALTAITPTLLNVHGDPVATGETTTPDNPCSFTAPLEVGRVSVKALLTGVNGRKKEVTTSQFSFILPLNVVMETRDVTYQWNGPAAKWEARIFLAPPVGYVGSFQGLVRSKDGEFEDIYVDDSDITLVDGKPTIVVDVQLRGAVSPHDYVVFAQVTKLSDLIHNFGVDEAEARRLWAKTAKEVYHGTFGRRRKNGDVTYWVTDTPLVPMREVVVERPLVQESGLPGLCKLTFSYSMPPITTDIDDVVKLSLVAEGSVDGRYAEVVLLEKKTTDPLSTATVVGQHVFPYVNPRQTFSLTLNIVSRTGQKKSVLVADAVPFGGYGTVPSGEVVRVQTEQSPIITRGDGNTTVRYEQRYRWGEPGSALARLYETLEARSASFRTSGENGQIVTDISPDARTAAALVSYGSYNVQLRTRLVDPSHVAFDGTPYVVTVTAAAEPAEIKPTVVETRTLVGAINQTETISVADKETLKELLSPRDLYYYIPYEPQPSSGVKFWGYRGKVGGANSFAVDIPLKEVDSVVVDLLPQVTTTGGSALLCVNPQGYEEAEARGEVPEFSLREGQLKLMKWFDHYSYLTDASYLFWRANQLEYVSLSDWSRIVNATAMFVGTDKLAVAIPLEQMRSLQSADRMLAQSGREFVNQKIDAYLPALVTAEKMLEDNNSVASLSLNAPLLMYASRLAAGTKFLREAKLLVPVALSVEEAFKGCVSLRKLTIAAPHSTSVQGLAEGANSLTDVTFSSPLTSLRYDATYNEDIGGASNIFKGARLTPRSLENLALALPVCSDSTSTRRYDGIVHVGVQSSAIPQDWKDISARVLSVSLDKKPPLAAPNTLTEDFFTQRFSVENGLFKQVKPTRADAFGSNTPLHEPTAAQRRVIDACQTIWNKGWRRVVIDWQ